ncbi:hypothetical protein V1477_007076 [Vespula maculifrons]|uniref:Uncharacterized protein n=1 Tax=Vespula maculifrons TaxID=7453 RepID=A0ABD2CHH4_VESMC
MYLIAIAYQQCIMLCNISTNHFMIDHLNLADYHIFQPLQNSLNTILFHNDVELRKQLKDRFIFPVVSTDKHLCAEHLHQCLNVFLKKILVHYLINLKYKSFRNISCYAYGRCYFFSHEYIYYQYLAAKSQHVLMKKTNIILIVNNFVRNGDINLAHQKFNTEI